MPTLDVSMKDPFEGMTDSERSEELLKRRGSLWEMLQKEHPELGVSKVDMHGWPRLATVSLVVEIHTEEARKWILSHIPMWEELTVVPYTPCDLHELTILKYHARRIARLLRSPNPENRLLAQTLLEEWIGD